MVYKKPVYKRCDNCGGVYPDTREHFGIQSTGKNWKQAWCLECRKEWIRKKNDN